MTDQKDGSLYSKLSPEQRAPVEAEVAEMIRRMEMKVATRELEMGNGVERAEGE